MKDTYVDGEKLARNGQKTAPYYAASFLPHYRRALFLHLVVFNLWIMEVNDNFFTNFVLKQSIALLFGILLFSSTK